MKGFSHAANGYNIEEVNRFLDKVIKKVEEMMSENNTKELKIKELEDELSNYNRDEIEDANKKLKEYESIGSREELLVLKTKLDHYVKMEETLQNAILMSQKTCEQMKTSAYNERETIIEEAKKNANRIINEALLEAEKAERDATMIRRNVNVFKRRLKDILETQLDVVNDIEKIEL